MTHTETTQNITGAQNQLPQIEGQAVIDTSPEAHHGRARSAIITAVAMLGISWGVVRGGENLANAQETPQYQPTNVSIYLPGVLRNGRFSGSHPSIDATRVSSPTATSTAPLPSETPSPEPSPTGLPTTIPDPTETATPERRLFTISPNAQVSDSLDRFAFFKKTEGTINDLNARLLGEFLADDGFEYFVYEDSDGVQGDEKYVQYGNVQADEIPDLPENFVPDRRVERTTTYEFFGENKDHVNTPGLAFNSAIGVDTTHGLRNLRLLDEHTREGGTASIEYKRASGNEGVSMVLEIKNVDGNLHSKAKINGVEVASIEGLPNSFDFTADDQWHTMRFVTYDEKGDVSFESEPYTRTRMDNMFENTTIVRVHTDGIGFSATKESSSEPSLTPSEGNAFDLDYNTLRVPDSSLKLVYSPSGYNLDLSEMSPLAQMVGRNADRVTYPSTARLAPPPSLAEIKNLIAWGNEQSPKVNIDVPIYGYQENGPDFNLEAYRNQIRELIAMSPDKTIILHDPIDDGIPVAEFNKNLKHVSSLYLAHATELGLRSPYSAMLTDIASIADEVGGKVITTPTILRNERKPEQVFRPQMEYALKELHEKNLPIPVIGLDVNQARWIDKSPAEVRTILLDVQNQFGISVRFDRLTGSPRGRVTPAQWMVGIVDIARVLNHDRIGIDYFPHDAQEPSSLIQWSFYQWGEEQHYGSFPLRYSPIFDDVHDALVADPGNIEITIDSHR